MSLVFAVIAALIIEQFYPLGPDNRFYEWYARYADFLQRRLNAGASYQGIIAWLAAIFPALFVAGAVYYVLTKLHPFLGWLWNVMLLYATMGFRQFSHIFTRIHKALREGDLQQARVLLSQWRREEATQFSTNEIVRVVIEDGLVCSHRYVFGVIFWFAVLPGPLGAVLYRFASVLSEKWDSRRDVQLAGFGNFAVRIFNWIDWVPVRLTAISFAIVGDFEDALHCWRVQAMSWIDAEQGVILASGAGALGVRLGEPLHQYDSSLSYRPELGLGDEADVQHLESAIGLVWRAVVLWLLVLLLFGLAVWARG
ncbi:MAG TPA: CobD/CbiB family protein [Burkholderiales bacterium]|nr:CobD/CbiB family protein [Burkholderiales bacterium]